MAMIYPSRSDYSKAVRNLEKTILCEHYQGGVPRKTGRRLAIYSGGYSVVFPIDFQVSHTAALRCWLRDIKSVKELYSRAGEFLKTNPIEYYVDFEYVDNGIKVNNQTYPLLYMEWINGLELDKYIDKNINNPDRIRRLSELFAEMVATLHTKEVSHGDLQDGNILVCNYNTSPELRLIDYDTLYVSTMEDLPRFKAGVSGYQHPLRADVSIEDAKFDYFSELVIYLSLLAYAEKPSLWIDGKGKREQQLVFSAADFLEPDKSLVFRELESLSSKVVKLSKRLKGYCKETDLNKLKPLEEVVSEIKKTYPAKVKKKAVSVSADDEKPAQVARKVPISPKSPPVQPPAPPQNHIYVPPSPTPAQKSTSIDCMSCKVQNPIDNIYCKNCLSHLHGSITCINCNTIIAKKSFFCNNCGWPQM
jgi:serine/threonine protein kinase